MPETKAPHEFPISHLAIAYRSWVTVQLVDGRGVSGSGWLEAPVERLLARVRELESVVVQQRRVIVEQADRMAKQAGSDR